MSSLRDLDVKVSAYSPELPPHAFGSREHPAVGPLMVQGFFGGARSRGERPVFVFEGPDAEEAARRLRATINAHPSEVLPGSVRVTPGDLLRKWGFPDAAEDYERSRVRRPRAEPKETSWK